MTTKLFTLAEQTGRCLQNHNRLLVTAESCTGGWISQMITSVSGSSAWFDRGFITYSNQAKIQMLGVNPETLNHYGAVSAEVASEMVTGALSHSAANIALAVTGIAGPDGGSPEKPVGTVFIAWLTKDQPLRVIKKQLTGSRHQIRALTVKYAMEGLLEYHEKQGS